MVETDSVFSSYIPEIDTSGNLLPGYAWTGTPHNSASTRVSGTITVPSTDALDTLLVRYIEDGQHHTAVLHAGDTRFGAYGEISVQDGVLTISTTRETTVESVLAYDAVLPEPEVAQITAMGRAWSWAGLMPRLSGITRYQPSEPLVIGRTTPAETLLINRTYEEL